MLLFGWLCMVGLLLVLDRFRLSERGLWLLPPLFALWINFHGSWVFGVAVLGATIASGWWKASGGWPWRAVGLPYSSRNFCWCLLLAWLPCL